jgi:hypothetical protein
VRLSSPVACVQYNCLRQRLLTQEPDGACWQVRCLPSVCVSVCLRVCVSAAIPSTSNIEHQLTTKYPIHPLVSPLRPIIHLPATPTCLSAGDHPVSVSFRRVSGLAAGPGPRERLCWLLIGDAILLRRKCLPTSRSCCWTPLVNTAPTLLRYRCALQPVRLLSTIPPPTTLLSLCPTCSHPRRLLPIAIFKSMAASS